MPTQTISAELSPILRDGFGKASKLVVLDTRLSLAEKALYGVFCSVASRDGECYVPRRDDFLAILGINKNKYYKILGSIRSDDYDETGKHVIRKYSRLITIALCDSSEVHGWQFNQFRLEYRPDMYMKADAMAGSPAWQNALRLVQDIGSIYAGGYGIVPRRVMMDPSLSLEAKGIYTYLCTFDSNHTMAHPDNDTMCYHLGINRKTLQKYLQELEAHGYISRVRSSRTQPYRYVLNEDPEHPLPSGIVLPGTAGFTSTIPSKSKNEDTSGFPEPVSKSTNEDISSPEETLSKSLNKDTSDDVHVPKSKIADISGKEQAFLMSENRDTSHRDISVCDTSDADTIKTPRISTNNISTGSSQSIHPLSPSNLLSQEEQLEIDRWMDYPSAKEMILDELFEQEELPYDTLRHPQKLGVTVKVLLDWDHRCKRSFYRNGPVDMDLDLYKILVNDLTEMLTYGTYTEVAGAKIPYAKVYEQLCENYLNIDPDSGTADLGDLIQEVSSAMTAANQRVKEPIRNVPKYLKGIIWSVLLDGGAKWSLQADRDLADSTL